MVSTTHAHLRVCGWVTLLLLNHLVGSLFPKPHSKSYTCGAVWSKITKVLPPWEGYKHFHLNSQPTQNEPAYTIQLRALRVSAHTVSNILVIIKPRRLFHFLDSSKHIGLERTNALRITCKNTLPGRSLVRVNITTAGYC